MSKLRALIACGLLIALTACDDGRNANTLEESIPRDRIERTSDQVIVTTREISASSTWVTGAGNLAERIGKWMKTHDTWPKKAIVIRIEVEIALTDKYGNQSKSTERIATLALDASELKKINWDSSSFQITNFFDIVEMNRRGLAGAADWCRSYPALGPIFCQKIARRI